MDFLEKLQALAPPPYCNHRPFTCRGSLLDCTVVVIGKNPRTKLNTNWWNFFADDLSFDYKAFMTCYRAHGEPSRARYRFNYLRECGLHCVETNVYADEGPRGYVPTALQLDVLRLLIDELPHLEAVIVHGDDAKYHLPSLRPGILRRGALDYPTKQHFSYIGFSKPTMELATIVAKIKERRKG